MKFYNCKLNSMYINTLSNKIYKDFIYLSTNKELNHNIKFIKESVENGNFILAFDKFMIGYILYELKTLQDGRLICYINYIYLNKDYRSKNIGTDMLNILINYCKSNSIKFIILTYDDKNVKLNKFYNKFQFKLDQFLNKTRVKYYCKFVE